MASLIRYGVVRRVSQDELVFLYIGFDGSFDDLYAIYAVHWRNMICHACTHTYDMPCPHKPAQTRLIRRFAEIARCPQKLSFAIKVLNIPT